MNIKGAFLWKCSCVLYKMLEENIVIVAFLRDSTRPIFERSSIQWELAIAPAKIKDENWHIHGQPFLVHSIQKFELEN